MRNIAIVALLLTLFLSACGDSRENALPGYMEAELVLVGAEEGGRIGTLTVKEGSRVTKGDALFTLESDSQQASLAAAQGRLEETEAALKLSKVSLERARDLRERGVVSQARLDDAQSAYDSNLASVASARATHDEASVRLEKSKVFAPQGGSIEEVYFRVGEVVSTGQPVVAILPPGNIKVRFYVSEPVRASIHVGEVVSISCDGCPSGLSASVSFIAREAEYTPPVIFSREERRKLVYLVEARPMGDTAKLTAGQPVTVSLVPLNEVSGS